MEILQINNIKLYISDKSDWDSMDTLNSNFKNFFFVKQIHSWNIFELNNKTDFDLSRNIEYDWIITKLLSTKIWVRLADCNWIVIYWVDYICVLHWWWKWIYNKILENWINLLLKKWEKIENLNIYIWPSIRSCCYEVWDEFYDYFDKKYFNKNQNWRQNLDLVSIIKDKLIDFWINQDRIQIDNMCTKCSNLYYSYRNWDNKERFVVWVEKI